MAKEAVENAKKLEAWLKEFPTRIAKKGLRKASRESAKIVAADAKRLVPEDTGTLADSIKVRALKRTRKGRIGHGINAGSGKEFTAEGLPFYASFVELGTKFMAADPFLRPALWGNQDAVRRKFHEVLGAFLKNEKGAIDKP